MKTIAEHMKDIMLEQDIDIVGFATFEVLHECAERSGMYKNVRSEYGSHPINICSKVLTALQRSDLFEEWQLKHIGRPGRMFTLKEDSRSNEI